MNRRLKKIEYVCKGDISDLALSSLSVEGLEHLLKFTIKGNSTLLNAIQVDKLRQQLHGWLHERANAPDGANWYETYDDEVEKDKLDNDTGDEK